MHAEPSTYAATAHWSGGFDEPGLKAWAAELRARLLAPRVSLGLVFLTPRFFAHAVETLEVLRLHARVPLLVGCSAGGLIVAGQELEEDPGLALGLFHFPGADLRAFHFTQKQVEEIDEADGWRREAGVAPDKCNGWLVFADPFHMDLETWLRTWNDTFAPAPTLGGLASGDMGRQQTQVYLNGEAWTEGGVAVCFGGRVRLRGLVSQGCTPIGEQWTITKAEQNLIYRIANRPAYEVLVETFAGLPPEQQKRARFNVLIGLVGNEYQEEFHRGDFLVRNLLGGDPNSGILAVGAVPRTGQTLQFQCRDPSAASEDFGGLLRRTREELGQTRVYGGCLCSCNGRGFRFFNVRNHDPAMVQRHLGAPDIMGLFCNGELGPIGNRSFVHSYSASLALFTAG